MALSKLQFAPGIHKESTQYSVGPSWYDCDKIRFRMGRVEQIGGWTKYSEDSFKGVPRALFDWGVSDGSRYLGVGTNLKLYVEYGGTYSDITPIRETTAAGAVAFAAVNGDATLTVTDTSHNAVAGDYVTYTDATTLGGNITAAVLNQEYRVDTVVDTDNYTIEAKDTNGDEVLANGSDTSDGNDGTGTIGAYQLNIGTNSFIPGTGFGVDTFSSNPWGGGGSLSIYNQLRLWSLDEFGGHMLANPRLGAIYFWDNSDLGTRAVDVATMGGASNTPTTALQVMVSPTDRHVIAFGVNPLGSGTIDPLLVRWSDQESAVDWTPTATNTAGGQVLSTGSIIAGAIRTRQEILIFTDTSIHAMRYSGAPFIFSFSVVSENVSVVSSRAMVSTGDAVYFMDLEGFYVYKGSVQRMPCTVLEYVFSNLDISQTGKIFAANNQNHSEVTWFYPAGGEGSEVNSYVTYNYLDNVWTVGTMDRGAWTQAPTKNYPIAGSNDTVNVETNYLYNHEFGTDADGADIEPYIESGSISIGDGDSLMLLKRFIPDFKLSGIEKNVNFAITIKGSDFPTDTPVEKVVKTISSGTKQAHVRVRAREIAMRIEGSGQGYGWTMGDFRFDMRTHGRR